MPDELALGSRMSRGTRAEQLVNDDLLKEAFAALENEYIVAWRQTEVRDTAYREKLHIAINVIGKVKEHLAMVAADGKLAAKELDILSKAAEPKKRFGIV
jgi:hypothetical protein